MAFYADIENNPKLNNEIHVPKSVRSKISCGGTIDKKMALPPTNFFCGLTRQKPQTGFVSNGLISNNGQLDYYLGGPGFVEKLVLEMEVSISGTAANPVQILPPYLINRVEIYDSNQNPIQTIYADLIFFDRINWTVDKNNFENPAQGVSTTFGPQAALAAGATARYELTIPCWINQVQPKISVIENKMLVRVFFSNAGVISGAATDLSVTLCDLIQHSEQLSGPLESMETNSKKSRDLKYRVLNPTRVASLSYAMVASSQYDVQLVSANQMSAFLFFIVRPTPGVTSAATIQSLTAIDRFELYDKNYTLQGITITNEQNKYELAQRFFGNIFTSTLGQKIYVLPFAVDMAEAHKGNQCGFYQFTTTEILRIYTPAGFASGNYVVDVYSYDYAQLEMDHGILNLLR